MTTIADLVVTLVVLVALAGAGFWMHHLGYISGQDERTSHFAPLMEAASDALAKANAHALEVETSAESISQQQEAQNAQVRETLAARVDAANGRINELLRQLAASHPTAGRQSVPTPTGAPAVIAGPTPSAQRDAELSRRVSVVGGQCEHDADELAAFQSWYSRQRANVDTKATVK
jgi:hypothetical protein